LVLSMVDQFNLCRCGEAEELVIYEKLMICINSNLFSGSLFFI
jgi:hypothetical protein